VPKGKILKFKVMDLPKKDEPSSLDGWSGAYLKGLTIPLEPAAVHKRKKTDLPDNRSKIRTRTESHFCARNFKKIIENNIQ
jgi:hypothetical protein